MKEFYSVAESGFWSRVHIPMCVPSKVQSQDSDSRLWTQTWVLEAHSEQSPESRLRVQSLDHGVCLVTENQNQTPDSRLWTQSQENKADSRVQSQSPVSGPCAMLRQRIRIRIQNPDYGPSLRKIKQTPESRPRTQTLGAI